MTIIQPSRRGFLRGLGLVIAAPAIVRAASLMPVRGWSDAPPFTQGLEKLQHAHLRELLLAMENAIFFGSGTMTVPDFGAPRALSPGSLEASWRSITRKIG